MQKKQIVEKILLSTVKQYAKERCALLGYVPTDIPKATFHPNQEHKIKIAGDYTLLRDTAVWRDLNQDSKFKELDFNHVEMELILYRFLKEFCGNQTKELKEISITIQNSKTQLINPENSISDLAKMLLSI